MTIVELPARPGLVARESAEPGTLYDLAAMAERRGWNAAALALVIETESGWRPNAANPGSTAQGLSQLIASTRKMLGLGDIRGMSARAQLRRAVEPFFARVLGSQKPTQAWQYYAANFIGTTRGERGRPLRDANGELVPGNPAYEANKDAFDCLDRDARGRCVSRRGWIGPEHLEGVLAVRLAKARGLLKVDLSKPAPALPTSWLPFVFVGLVAGAVALRARRAA